MSVNSPSLLTEAAFDRRLARLDPDRDRAGEKYELLHTKLSKFFEWRGSPWPEEQADQCLDRLIRRLERDDRVDNVEAFVAGVARLMVLEGWRERERERGLLALATSPVQPAEESNAREASDRCLETCLSGLAPDESELIIEYYRGEGPDRIPRRRELATRLGVPMGVLRLRVHRIRSRIEGCLRRCLGPARLVQSEVAPAEAPSAHSSRKG